MPTTVTSTPQPGLEERRISPESLRLPHALEEEEGEFVAIIKITSKPGRSDELEGLIRAIHEETDENELDVYSHRILRGYYDEDLDTVCIVIEYNTNASFYSHHRGKAIKRLYASDCVCELEPPVLSFWRDVHW